jgi:hypothetical protein
LLYWKKRLLSVPLTAIASQIRANDPVAGQPEQLYYLLSDILPEDRITRLQLARDLLNEMLEKQQEERSDKGKARPCLFCRQAPRGRDELFEHMRDAHGFAVGQPDNLVGIDRLLDLLRAKLDGLQCIYCFPESDHEILTSRGFWRLADVERISPPTMAIGPMCASPATTSARARSSTRRPSSSSSMRPKAPTLLSLRSSKNDASGVDIVVTRGHNMFVRCETTDNDGQFRSCCHSRRPRLNALWRHVPLVRCAMCTCSLRRPPASAKQCVAGERASLVDDELVEHRRTARGLPAARRRTPRLHAMGRDALAPWVWQLDAASVRLLLAPLNGAAGAQRTPA